MLRQQLIARLGVLVVGFVAGAIVAIVLLQGILQRLNVVAERGAAMFEDVHVVIVETASAETALAEDAVAGAVRPAEQIRAAHRRLGAHPVMTDGGAGAEILGRSTARLRLLDSLLHEAAEGDPERYSQLVAVLSGLRSDARELGEIASRATAEEQIGVSHDLRNLIIGLTVAALVMANVAVLVLIRTVQLILRPVAALVDGSRLLAAERFEHRVRVDREDEFGELARAYNHLAGQLQANERRRIETLRQLAVTLNHEINNVINVIELQLGILDRRAGGDAVLAGHLRHIREALHRIARTIASLRDLRRIVITDYAPGQRMLDLARSTESSPEDRAVAASAGDDDA